MKSIVGFLLLVFWFPFTVAIVGNMSLDRGAKKQCSLLAPRYDISRVFMHLPKVYSVMILEGNRLKNLPIGRANIYANLSEGQQPYINIESILHKGKYLFIFDSYRCELKSSIYIHSAQDMGGGSWRGNKGRSGRTVVVE